MEKTILSLTTTVAGERAVVAVCATVMRAMCRYIDHNKIMIPIGVSAPRAMFTIAPPE
jgi:hypothetical protein